MIDSVQTLHCAELSSAAGSVGPGARGRRRDHAGRQGAADRGAAGRPRDQGRARWPGRACSSTSSTACSSSRASASAPTGPCARSRTGSARPTRPACSRCATTAWSRCSTPRRGSWPRPRARRAASCCARWRARGRCWSRSRRSSRSSELVPPRRVVAGLDRNRARAGAGRPRPPRGRSALGAADVFVNVVGGVRVDEPGADLAVALAVASAAQAAAAQRGRRGAPAGVLRRARADGRAAHRGPRRPPARRGGEVRPRAGDRARRCTRTSARQRSTRALGGRARRRSARCMSASDSAARSVRFWLDCRVKSACMPPRSGEELKEELESRQESRIVRALEMVAPGPRCARGSTTSSTPAPAA